MNKPARDGSVRAIPRLRFDKVALRLVQAVRGALEGAVPDGLCVLFAVAAPIREPAKTAAALIGTIRARLGRGAAPGDHQATLHGNQVRLRVVASRSPHAARVAGFVHTQGPPPAGLLDLAQSLLDSAEAPDVTRTHAPPPNPQTLRQVCAQVRNADGNARAAAAVGRQRAHKRQAD